MPSNAHVVSMLCCAVSLYCVAVVELKLDMNFHIRFFDCAKKGSVEKLQQIQQFVEINYQNEVR